MTLADGRYQLERSLGEGGSADVWQATDTALGVPRAIKLLSGAAGQRVQLRGRLQSEARAMARLSHHPHILPPHSYRQRPGVRYLKSVVDSIARTLDVG